MKIVVLAKEVPDTAAPRHLNGETGLLERGQSDPVPDEINERTLEHALKQRDAGVEVDITVLTVGPESAEASVRKLLAMGADQATIVADPAIGGSDMIRTARILAAAIQRIEPDLVLAGTWSTDGGGGAVPSMVAELLGWPDLPSVDSVSFTDGSVSGTLTATGETVSLLAPLPAVVSVTEPSAEPRFPNFKGIMKAKKKAVTMLSLADLGTSATEASAASVMVSAAPRPPRAAGSVINDDGSAGEQIAEFLASHRLI